MKIYQYPCLDDNYNYLFFNDKSPEGPVAVIDPSTAKDCKNALRSLGLDRLDFILNTHHHWDHVGGNKELKESFNCEVIGPSYDRERIPEIDREVSEGDSFFIGDSEAQIFFTPGHTLGHILYFFPQEQALFCGDTLFSLGCGRLFEGTAEQMFSSLAKIKALPEDTQILCAHEYSLDNAEFALTVDPDNKNLKEAYLNIVNLRKNLKPTVPSLLGLELKTNPFLRAPNLEIFAEIRKNKDKF